MTDVASTELSSLSPFGVLTGKTEGHVMSDDTEESRNPPSKAYIQVSSSFTRSKKFELTVKTIPCGDAFLYRHNDGYPLASKAVLKPLVMPLENVKFYTTDVVEKELSATYKIKEVSAKPQSKTEKRAERGRLSVRKSMRRVEVKRAGNARVTLDNNFITLFREEVTVFQACWFHLYGIYHEEFGNNGLLLIFYKAAGSGLADGKSTLSGKVTDFVTLKLHIKDKTETLEGTLESIHRAVKGQASYLRTAASVMIKNNDSKGVTNAEAYYRGIVDLEGLSGETSPERKLKAIEELKGYLEKYKKEECSAEITLWDETMTKLKENGVVGTSSVV